MIGNIIYNIFITPIEMVIELIFSIINRIAENPGIAIIGVSLVVNFLVLPLYKKSDDLSEEERDKQKEMKPWIDHIKKTFKGDERYMMTQEYYRTQKYKPIYALRSSLSLLLQIPFFIAAYHYLSNLSILQDASFLCFANLGQPDGLLQIGGISINILPILMTLINVVSALIYLRGFPIRDKIQTYGIAAIFLVLLYNSPSGLVFYWTLNQIFSVCKNVVMKLLPKKEKKIKPEVEAIEKKFFIVPAVALALFTGFIIPFSIVYSSPQEFVGISRGPLELVIKTFAIMLGFFVLWLSIFYYLSNNKGKNIFTGTVWILLGVGVVDFFLFGKSYGNIDASLIFTATPDPGIKTKLINLIVLFVVIGIVVLFLKKFKGFLKAAGSIAIIACIGLTGFYMVNVNNSVSDIPESKLEEVSEVTPVYNLSKKGKNVIVFMLDRLTGGFIDASLEQDPKLVEMFDGFTYYKNCISYSGCTNYSTPALFGGFEYTPVNMNKRENESLKDKHNEAIQVLPKIFNDEKYRITLSDIPYAKNYEWTPDMSLYDEYENASSYILEGKYTRYCFDNFTRNYDAKQERNMVYYSLFKCAPVALHEAIYDEGCYLSNEADKVANVNFLNCYSQLKLLKELTKFSDDGNSFIMMQNSSTHMPTMLDKNFEVTDKMIPVVSNDATGELNVHVASLRAVGQWLDYLRQEGVYDNTKIILVGDHGCSSYFVPEMIDDKIGDAELYHAGLLVKDFNAKGFSVSDDFMTIADVPVLATEDVINNATNPFTHNRLSNDYKQDDSNIVFTTSTNWDTLDNNGNVFDTSDGEWVKLINKNIFDLNNYIFLQKESLP